MNELGYAGVSNLMENITNTKCIECNDRLTSWEIRLCILCDNESEQEFEFDDEVDL